MDNFSETKPTAPDGESENESLSTAVKVENSDQENGYKPSSETVSSSENSFPDTESQKNDSASLVAQPDSQLDPFAYLNRSFTSENFKVEIRGLPRFYGFGVSKSVSMSDFAMITIGRGPDCYCV